MDVQCERCKTEYEFDDALVSGRGTTVRCTQCGHQFKVRKGEASPSEPAADRWVVTTTLGKQLTYTTLRELQRAIMAKQLARSDTLTRGDAPPRLLGSIAELEPFFEGRGSTGSTRPPPGSGGSVAQRLPPPPATPSEAMLDLPKRTPAWGVDQINAAAPSSFPPPRPRSNTLRPPDGGAAVPPPPAARGTMPGFQEATPAPAELVATMSSNTSPARAVEPAPIVAIESALARGPEQLVNPAHTPPMPAAVLTHDVEPPTQPRPAYVDPTPAPATYQPAHAYQPEFSSPLPPPTAPRRVLASSIDEDAMAEAMRASAFSDPDSLGLPRRRRVGGWIVALVLLGGVAVVGFAVGRPYLAAMGKPASSVQALDEKTQQFLNDGDKALADGNLDAAKENYDKALARDDKSQRVLIAVARLAAVRADVPWLRARVLPDSATDDVKATKQSLVELAAAARKAADDALSVSPDEPAAIRAKIDASRISGESDTARRLVSKVIAQATQPETAYVLAALDLAEPDPVWPTVIDRLRLAAQGEGNAGRARAALIYALARSGDKASAKMELEKLDKLARPYPLTGPLRVFVDQVKSKAVVDGGARVSSSTPVVDVSQLPSSGKPGEQPLEGRGPTQQAMNALAKGDKDRARAIYEAQIARNPNDSEALSGLGDVSRAQGDTSGAIASYKRALAVNPSYLPAIVGLADTYWATGNRGEAMRLYKEITDRFPDGAYPAYVKQRAEGGAPAPATSPATTPTATPSASSAAPPATSTATTPTPAASTPAPKPSNNDGF